MNNINLLWILSTDILLSLIIAKILQNKIKKHYSFVITFLLLMGSISIPIIFQKPESIFLSVLFFGLFVLSVMDIAYRILPNSINFALLAFGLGLGMQNQFISLPQAIGGAVSGYFILWAISGGYKSFTGKPGIGGGDMKLASALGTWVGISNIPLLLFWSSFLGCLFYCSMAVLKGYTRESQIPFGCFLSIAGISIFIVRFFPLCLLLD